MPTLTEEIREQVLSWQNQNRDDETELTRIEAMPTAGWAEYDRVHKVAPAKVLRDKIAARQFAIMVAVKTAGLAYDEQSGEPIAPVPPKLLERARAESRLTRIGEGLPDMNTRGAPTKIEDDELEPMTHEELMEVVESRLTEMFAAREEAAEAQKAGMRERERAAIDRAKTLDRMADKAIARINRMTA